MANEKVPTRAERKQKFADLAITMHGQNAGKPGKFLTVRARPGKVVVSVGDQPESTE